MKRPIHLYIFVALSTIATVLRIHGAFLSRFDEASYRALFDGVQVEGLDNLVAMAQASADFSSNLINKGLIILQLVLLLVTIFFLFKKANERASYAYIAYSLVPWFTLPTLTSEVCRFPNSSKQLTSTRLPSQAPSWVMDSTLFSLSFTLV